MRRDSLLFALGIAFCLMAAAGAVGRLVMDIKDLQEQNQELQEQYDNKELELTVYTVEETPATEYAAFDSNTIGWDYGYVMRVVGAEARGESPLGIMAVAQCIKDTAEARGMTPEEVVREPGQYTDPMPSEFYDGGEMVNECCLRVFAENEIAVNDNIRFFCTPSHNSFHRSHYEYVCSIGGHEFYKEK